MRLYTKAIFLLLAIAAEACAASPCWKSQGEQAASGPTTFGSTEQGKMLQALAQANPKCPFVGIVWSIDYSKRGGRGIMYSLLLWDVDAMSLVRLHVHSETDVSWESWSSVTRESLKSEDMSDGFDFPNYTTGRGRAPLTPAALKFVKAHQTGAGLTPGI